MKNKVPPPIVLLLAGIAMWFVAHSDYAYPVAIPFARTRNPMYVGLFLILLAWGVWLQGLSNAAILLIFVLWLTELQIKPEEAALEKLFGQSYVDYCERVRRWL